MADRSGLPIAVGWAPILEALALATIGLAAIATRLVNIDRYTGSYPEGIRAAQLQLMAAGYRPFADIFSDQGPWLLQALYPGYALLGGSIAGVRAGVVVASLVGLAGLYWLVRQIAGRLAALVGLALLVLSPIYLLFSRLAVAEVLALAPAVLALGCAVRFSVDARERWLYLSALCLATSLLLKPITLGTAAPVALAIWLGSGPRARNVIRVGAATAAFLLVGAAMVGLPEVAQQIVEFRLASRQAEGWSLANNLGRLRSELRDEGWGLPALAALGAALSLRQPRAWPLLVWAVAAAGTLLGHAPLHSKHFAILVMPLVALAGYGVGRLSHVAGRTGRRPTHLAAVAAGAGLILVGASLPSVLARDARLLSSDDLFDRDTARPWYDEAAETLGLVLGPEEMVVTDHAYLAYAAGRLMPPRLVEASATRVSAGSLTDAEMIEQIRRHDVRAILLWKEKLDGLRQFRGWLTEEYVPAKVWAVEGDSRPVLWLRNDERLDESRARLRAAPGWRAAAQPIGGWQLAGARLHSRAPGSTGRPALTWQYGDEPFQGCRTDEPSITLEWERLRDASDDPRVIVALRKAATDRDALDEEREPLLGGVGRPAWLFWVGALPISRRVAAGDYQLTVELAGVREPPHSLGGFRVPSC